MRSGDSNEWESDNPVLTEGELGVEVDTGLFKIGDGDDDWIALDYGGPRGIVTVKHGLRDDLARPPAAKVYWLGETQPLNATENDIWMETSPPALGGDLVFDITQNGIDYRVHVFTTSDGLVVSRGGEVEYLIVAGGGGGGSDRGGGGGGGGLRAGTAVVTEQTYSVVIGSGGTRAVATAGPAGSGTNSSALGLTATGGGGGGSGSTTDTRRFGASGGSGGGGGGVDLVFGTGGSGTAGQGNDGGDAAAAQNAGSGGGGGGAGSVGQDATTGSDAGDGGAGVTSAITGTSLGYAGGGGGGKDFRSGSGDAGVGSDGGGNAADNAVNVAQVGIDGRGGGGGGGSIGVGSAFRPGADGGDGIVIVRYRL